MALLWLLLANPKSLLVSIPVPRPTTISTYHILYLTIILFPYHCYHVSLSPYKTSIPCLSLFLHHIAPLLKSPITILFISAFQVLMVPQSTLLPTFHSIISHQLAQPCPLICLLFLPLFIITVSVFSF